ncbi:hypothetical protein O1611_g684 [Lasiodiplodia mahajangana]|uniref:Uncharacterized protein n=1 Tax=Lasiodiplodia mahajangana TaxID=1108764 RepID=A0ACC2JZW0_9PEZI|nr:hypothetical protein O1611_g684 [Lasiodiplodia mahajangana]
MVNHDENGRFLPYAASVASPVRDDTTKQDPEETTIRAQSRERDSKRWQEKMQLLVLGVLNDADLDRQETDTEDDLLNSAPGIFAHEYCTLPRPVLTYHDRYQIWDRSSTTS